MTTLLSLPVELHHLLALPLTYGEISNLRLTCKLLARRFLDGRFWKNKGQLDCYGVSQKNLSFFDVLDIPDPRKRYFTFWQTISNLEPRLDFKDYPNLKAELQYLALKPCINYRKVKYVPLFVNELALPICQEEAGNYFSDLIGAMATSGEIHGISEIKMQNYLTNVSHFEILFRPVIDCLGHRFKKLTLRHPLYWIEPSMFGYYGPYRFEFVPASIALTLFNRLNDDLKEPHLFFKCFQIRVYSNLVLLLEFNLEIRSLERINLILDCLDYFWSLDNLYLNADELETLFATVLDLLDRETN